ncbi:hypothetical protein RDWZM_008863 [Blomia tropicalis]|uniref:Uncharacterized protein n=1 Tax=Blomia tropicalis TaxID=40697 RepID=A0A9Q0RLU2_BLOTA|nr:hypothetical protein RDWZM_008863 [Blomia tropicalis]
MEVKRMQAEFKKTIEQIRSVESDIIQSQQMLVDSLRETNAKLETLDMTFKLVNKIMKTGIIMERLFQRAKNNQDFSKEFQHIYGNLEFCDKNYSCPMKVAQFKGCFYKKNQTEINMITMRIENNIINPNFKVFEAHPFTLVHSDNTSFCYYKYIGEKYIVYQMNTGCVWPLFNPTVINLADNQLAFDFQPTDGICLPMLNESVDSSYVIDKCKTKSNDSSFTAFQVWPKIVQEKDFVYIYCFNHSITYQGITEECGNAGVVEQDELTQGPGDCSSHENGNVPTSSCSKQQFKKYGYKGRNFDPNFKNRQSNTPPVANGNAPNMNYNQTNRDGDNHMNGNTQSRMMNYSHESVYPPNNVARPSYMGNATSHGNMPNAGAGTYNSNAMGRNSYQNMGSGNATSHGNMPNAGAGTYNSNAMGRNSYQNMGSGNATSHGNMPNVGAGTYNSNAMGRNSYHTMGSGNVNGGNQTSRQANLNNRSQIYNQPRHINNIEVRPLTTLKVLTDTGRRALNGFHYVDVMVNGIIHTAFVDFGSQITVIDDSILDGSEELGPIPFEIIGFEAKYYATTDKMVSIYGQERRYNVVVAKQYKEPILLSINVFADANLSVNAATGRIFMENNKKSYVHSKEDIIIPPKRVMMIETFVSKDAKRHENLMMHTPDRMYAKSRIAVNNAIIKGDQNKIRVINGSDTARTIKKGQALAAIEQIQPSQINKADGIGNSGYQPIVGNTETYAGDDETANVNRITTRGPKSPLNSLFGVMTIMMCLSVISAESQPLIWRDTGKSPMGNEKTKFLNVSLISLCANIVGLEKDETHTVQACDKMYKDAILGPLSERCTAVLEVNDPVKLWGMIGVGSMRFTKEKDDAMLIEDLAYSKLE